VLVGLCCSRASSWINTLANQELCVIIWRGKEQKVFVSHEGERMKRATLTPTILLLLLLLSLVLGCAMRKHRKWVREGVMTVGLNKEAFILEWGKPDLQFMQNEFEAAAPGIYRDSIGRMGQRRPAYGVEAWVYKKHDRLLVFYGYRLIAYYHWSKVKDKVTVY
jgi:hypothetical protein